MASDLALDSARSVARSAREPGSGICFEDVTVAYKGTVVLERFSLTVAPGEIMAIIGPSGSGKTTALRAVAGFVRPVSGRIQIGERDVTDLPPYERDLGMVVQNYALFPHMRVDENVAFGLRARKEADTTVYGRVQECLRMVGMLNYARRYPRELSGGQQQRVAIARALAIRPRVLLLDEPLSALDAQIRRSMLDELARLHRELPALTVLYVTHDQTEALTLADRIAIMRDGRLVATGRSHALYRLPTNRFAAEFLGRANLLTVRREATSGAGSASDGVFARVRFGDVSLLARSAEGVSAGDECLLCIRPHDIGLQRPPAPVNALVGTVQSVVWQGDLHNVTLDLGADLGADLRGDLAGDRGDSILRLVSLPLREPPQPGDRLEVFFAPEDAVLIPAEAAHA
ncbi:MAG: ATP-binding cassette domain-containing protein [Azospirillaceae bacterium]|nr:ATP-binding cassette domain-containing protein [Azospirillaceae bacterium]